MLAEKQYLVLDGGLATEVTWSHGHQDIDGDPLWSARLLATNTDVLKTVHKSFLDHGADVIETASYQASIPGFMEHLDLSREQAHQLIVKSGQIACQVRDEFWAEEANRKDRRHPLVVGSIGAYGAYLHDASEYSGHYVDTMTTEDLSAWHKQQLRSQVDSGVDLVGFDTVPAVKEAEAIIAALREFPNTKAWISFSCKDAEHISHGESIHQAAEVAANSDNIVAVGMNCLPPQNVSSLLSHIPEKVKVTKNIVVYPNSGESWSKEKKWVGKASCIPLHTFVADWIDKGATWIGGCCRCTPPEISSIRAAMTQRLM